MAPIMKENIFSNVFYNSGLMGRIEELIMRESKLISAIEWFGNENVQQQLIRQFQFIRVLCCCTSISGGQERFINVQNICQALEMLDQVLSEYCSGGANFDPQQDLQQIVNEDIECEGELEELDTLCFQRNDDMKSFVSELGRALEFPTQF
ncbi:MAG: hypothetical protein EZS28_024116 [Streblomastix strix]|uniref:Uncharacterized protein n=1 Tax=Streblomastix strix TaxID=222440 RepID=A0A5J4VCS7_9EUKA|nr:MAG: hypothetical protein EZS28_024116 [Streblomastix strix]